jgi:hypothetical protein
MGQSLRFPSGYAVEMMSFDVLVDGFLLGLTWFRTSDVMFFCIMYVQL